MIYLIGATHYQWKKNGTDLLGMTNSSLIIESALKSDEGEYSCYLTNEKNGIETNLATLVVNIVSGKASGIEANYLLFVFVIICSLFLM